MGLGVYATVINSLLTIASSLSRLSFSAFTVVGCGGHSVLQKIVIKVSNVAEQSKYYSGKTKE